MTQTGNPNPTQTSIRLKPLPFHDLRGWESDDHAAAYRAFYQSAQSLISLDAPIDAARDALVPAAKIALDLGPEIVPQAAKAFFEANFRPHRIIQTLSPGLVTGYFEPEIQGSREKTPQYSIPIHKRPADLINLIAESERGADSQRLTHARKTATGNEPFPTRRQIDQGALNGQGLEIAYLADPVDKFFMQIQGSGRILFNDGSAIRLTYDGKNGFPYTSVGRYLIDQGEITRDAMTLDALGKWLRADTDRGARAMWQNQSYVFFRELNDNDDTAGPLGVDNTTLIPGRSLAVDTSYHALGTPIFVDAPDLKPFEQKPDAAPETGFRQLMIAQDVGSAITGPERGDIFFGTGTLAGQRAGNTKHAVTFNGLRPISAPNLDKSGAKSK